MCTYYNRLEYGVMYLYNIFEVNVIMSPLHIQNIVDELNKPLLLIKSTFTFQ